MVDNYLLSVWGDTVTRTLADGSEETLVGTLPGDEPVTMARNLATPPDVVAVAGGLAWWLDLGAGLTGEIHPYPDTVLDPGTPEETTIVLGPVNSVDYYSGYFVFSRPNNEIVASNLQTIDLDGLSFDKAEAAPDTLYRVYGASPILLVCGPDTIEVWQDVGASPFPFQRVTVIPVGLIAPWAIAGGAKIWDRPVLFVANDATVRQLKGYDPIIVSNESVVADIEELAAAGDADTLQAQVYTHGDNAIWSLSSPSWTWEYNLSTSAWHRRQSYQPRHHHTNAPAPWRARFAARFDHKWYAQDELDGGLLEITVTAQQEPDIVRLPTSHPDTPIFYDIYRAPLIARCESAAAKEMPVNLRLPTIYLDFTVGHDVSGMPEPVVMLSWSHDGGATWSNPLSRHLGGRGEYRTLVKLNNTGRSSWQGMRLRWEVVNPVPVVFHGAVAPRAQPSRPRQIGVVVEGASHG